MPKSHARRINRLVVVGLAAFALAAPAASGMIPDETGTSPEQTSGALASPDNRSVRPVYQGGSGSAQDVPSGALAHPDNRAVRVAAPAGQAPPATGVPSGALAHPDNRTTRPVAMPVMQAPPAATSTEWRTIAIGLSATLAALLAAMAAVGVARHQRHRAQLS